MAEAYDCLKIRITKVDYIASTEGINNVSRLEAIIAETKLSFEAFGNKHKIDKRKNSSDVRTRQAPHAFYPHSVVEL